MLSFFKTNDPYRLVGVFLLLLVFRVPMFIAGVPMILPELKWLLIGERLGSGDYIMYKDVWDYTAPLAVFVYKWLFILFGKSRIPYFILSIILVVAQAGIFNKVMLRNKAYNSSTYVPALVYMVFMNTFFDFLTLSPVFLSLTFVLLALNNLFKRMDNQTKDELFIFTGLYLALAVMFYFPSILFFVITMLSLIIYTGSIVRRMILLVYGFLIVMGLAGMYFYWFDDFLIFQHHFVLSTWIIDANMYLTWIELAFASLIPSLLIIVAIYKIRKLGKFINFQEKIQQVMLMFFLVGFLALMMAKDVSTFQLIYFVPSVAFFFSHYLLVIRHWLVAEAAGGIMIILILFNNLLFSYQWFGIDNFVDYSSILVEDGRYANLTYEKKILVVGDDLAHYSNASLATPYLNWDLAQIQLQHLNYYDNSAEVFVNMKNDLPEIIIDQENVIPGLFEGMPTIASKYLPLKGYPEIYTLKK